MTTPAAHDAAGGTPATCDQKATCGTCGQGFGEKLSHSLNYTLMDGATNVLRESCSNCSHELEAVLTADDSTYTGSAITSASIFYPEGWMGAQVQPDADDYADNVNAGTATVTTTVEGKELTTTFGIGQVDISSAAISFSPEDPTYTGNAFSPEVIVSYNGTELTEGTHYSMRWHDDNLIDANSYTVEITGMGNFTGTKIDYFIIEKANPAVTAPTPRELFYTGAEQELLEKGSAEGGTMYYSLGTEEGPGGTSLESIPTGKDAGTYYVWYQVMGDANHNNTNYERVEVTIRNAKPTVSLPKANTLTYDGTAQELITAGSVAEGQGTMQYALISIGADGEPDASDPVYSTEIPTAVDAGVYFVSTQVEGNENYASVGYPLIPVTIAKAKLTPKLTGNVTKVYDGTIELPEENSVALELEGLINADEVAVTHRLTYVAADAGTKKVKATLEPLPESVTNYELTATEVIAEVGEITPLTIDENAAAEMADILWDGTEKTATLTSVKMNGLDVTYQLTGNKATDVGAYKMKLKATGNFQGELELEFYIRPNKDILKDITKANVTSANQEAIDKAKEMVKKADTDDFPEEIKEAVDADLKAVEDKAKELEKQLKDASDAASTTDTTAAKAITAAKAKDTDKEVLTDAKEDLEDALETYGTNYTAAERNAIEDEIERLEKIIADITAAEETIKAIDALTVNSTKAKVEAAQAKYDALTDAQKKIVDNSTDGKLDELQGLVGNYKITAGNGGRWSQKSKGTLSFTCNGPLSKFTGIRVDGKAILSKHYTYKEGSTIVTLKTTYLNTLKLGNHTITFRYEDGEVTGNFTIQKEAVTPSTGDQFNIGLWAGIGGASVVALIVLLIIMKKKMK